VSVHHQRYQQVKKQQHKKDKDELTTGPVLIKKQHHCENIILIFYSFHHRAKLSSCEVAQAQQLSIRLAGPRWTPKIK
jgi:hypothetical protein